MKLNVGSDVTELKLPEVNIHPVPGLTLQDVPVKFELFEFIVTAAGVKEKGAQCVASMSDKVNCGEPEVTIVIELLAWSHAFETVCVTV